LELDEHDVKETVRNNGRHLSMDAPLTSDDDTNLYDVFKSNSDQTPEKGLMTDSLRTEVRRVLDTLNPREADVLRFYFGLDHAAQLTLEEIGDKFDLTRERVRQIKEKAIRKLKHESKCRNLKPYLG
jgi:RNA polymerase primary sigma factor